MAWLRKTRPVLLVVGLALGIGTLIGARSLTGASSADASNKNRSGEPPRPAGGTYVLGTVDTETPLVNYGLPQVLQSGTVTLVHVKDGDEVKAGQVLYEFDSTIQKEDVKRATAAVEYAQTKVNEAKTGITEHGETKKDAELAVKLAKRKVDLRAQEHNLIQNNLKTGYKAQGFAMDTWEQRLADDPTLFQAKVNHEIALGEMDQAKRRLEHLDTVDPEIKVKEAQAAMDQAKAELNKAQAAVDLCVVKAKTAGTVEQVSIGPGSTLGLSTRTPALWLIPAAKRVVRAEVEAEFAHRVGDNIRGKTVTIFDHSDPRLTYSGTVLRPSDAFLPKRGSAENPLVGDTRVIEVIVEVTDYAPAGKPPLRVGQRVRVNLGQ